MYFSNWLIHQTGESRKSWNWKKGLIFHDETRNFISIVDVIINILLNIFSQLMENIFFSSLWEVVLELIVILQWVTLDFVVQDNPAIRWNLHREPILLLQSHQRPCSVIFAKPSLLCSTEKWVEKLTFSWQFSVKTCEKVVKQEHDQCFYGKSPFFPSNQCFC